MDITHIRLYPDPALRRRAKPIKEITAEVRARAQELLELMYGDEGVGLAGPQIGWSQCIVAIDITGERKDPRVFVNPRITEKQGEIEAQEGCLSLPGIRAKVVRAARVRVVAYDLDGRRLEFEADELAARAFQHETDHLNGILFIDLISPAERMAIRHKLKEFEQEFKSKAKV